MGLLFLMLLASASLAIKQPFVTVEYMGNKLQACTLRGLLVCDFYVVTPFTLATLFMREDFPPPIEVNVEPGSTHMQPVNDPDSCDTFMAPGSGTLFSFSSLSIEPSATGTRVTGTWLYQKDLAPDSTGNMILRLSTRNAPSHSVSLNISMISVSGVRWTSTVTCSPDQTTNLAITDSPTGDTGITAATMPSSSSSSSASGTPAADTGTTQAPSADNTGIIVGAVIGGVALLAIASVIVALLVRRARR